MELMRRIGSTLQGLVYENRKLGLHIYVCRYLFIYLWLYWVFAAAHGLSLVVASMDSSIVAGCGLPIVVASLVAEHGL